MKLFYELPEKVKRIIADRVGISHILYCTPYDLDMYGNLTDGWLVITKTMIYSLRNKEIVDEIAIASLKSYKSVSLVGFGMLEAFDGDESKCIVCYSPVHSQRYLYIAKILDGLSRNKEAKIISEDDEGTCSKCGKMLINSRVCSFCTRKTSSFRKLLKIVKPYWMPLIAVIFMFCLSTALQIVVPYIYKVIIDSYLIPMKQELSNIFLLILAVALCQMACKIVTVIKDRELINISIGLSRKMRETIMNKINCLPLSISDRKKPGELFNRITSDTEALRAFIQDTFAVGFNEIIIFIGVTVAMLLVNWRLALLTLLPIPFAIIFTRLISSKMASIFRAQYRLADKANSILQDILSGIRVVKVFGKEEEESTRFRGVSREYADLSRKNEKICNSLYPVFYFFLGIGEYLMLYFGGYSVLDGTLRVGELIQITQYIVLLTGPLQWMSNVPRMFAEAMISVERIHEILDEGNEAETGDSGISVDIKGRVAFTDVTFGYRLDEPVLENINFETKAGEMIGIVGHSGAGKSTFINLIMKLYMPDSGKITIDGIDMNNINDSTLRAQLGVVLQETFLFSGTVLENIRYARPDASLHDIIRAAMIANAHDFIVRLPNGYDSNIGEDGTNLSGGERQRIAIARAILHNPQILILDEATASLDIETEQKIQEALSRLIKKRTTFAIAHRLSTLKNADRIIVIERGKIEEMGTHEELLRKKEIYYNMVMAQCKPAK